MSEITSKWITAPTRYLTMAEMTHNAPIFAKYFQNLGWTDNCIAAMLGNIQVESRINPGFWQGRTIPDNIYTTDKGFGLTQWTPARKLINWANDNELDYKEGDTQLLRIKYEYDNNLQWSTDNILNYTWQDFVKSTESPETLARVFVWAYERPEDPDIPLRQQYARNWYDKLPFLTKLFPWILFKFKR